MKTDAIPNATTINQSTKFNVVMKSNAPSSPYDYSWSIPIGVYRQNIEKTSQEVLEFSLRFLRPLKVNYIAHSLNGMESKRSDGIKRLAEFPKFELSPSLPVTSNVTPMKQVIRIEVSNLVKGSLYRRKEVKATSKGAMF